MEESSAETANVGVKKRAKLNNNGGDKTPSLPDSIVMHEILPRLPVKSLIRFQSVSKNWLANISKNPNFVKLHLKYSCMLRRQFFISNYNSGFCENTGTYFLLPHQECSNQNDLERGSGYNVSSEAAVVDCCNGLVCLYHEVWESERKCFFGVWNPATRKCDEINRPPGVHLALAYGFGYVASLDEYKIVASFGTECRGVLLRGLYVFSLRSGKWEKIFGNFEYSSKVGKWRKIRGVSDEVKEKMNIVLNLQGGGLWHEEIIYWPRAWGSKKNIIGFDLRSGELIDYTSMYWESMGGLQLFRLKGSLALCNCNGIMGSEFWMLKDGDDSGSWQKLFSVNLTNVPFITLSETRKCLVRQSKQFKLVEFCKEALESCEVYGHFGRIMKAIDHVESLVSPFIMTKSNEEEQNLEDDDAKAYSDWENDDGDDESDETDDDDDDDEEEDEDDNEDSDEDEDEDD